MVDCGLIKQCADKHCKRHTIVIALSVLSFFMVLQTDLSQFPDSDFMEEEHLLAIEEEEEMRQSGGRLIDDDSLAGVLDANNRTLNTTASSVNPVAVGKRVGNVGETTAGNKIEDKQATTRAATTQTNAKNNTSRTPTIFMHIGPHKTGTTSLQAFMHQYSQLLLGDNLHVISKDELWDGVHKSRLKDPEHLFAHCMIERYSKEGGDLTENFCHTKFMKNFSTTLLNIYSKGQDVLLIAEDLDRAAVSLERIQESVKPYTNIKISLSYRWMHDWFPSWYNEINKLYYRVYVTTPDHPMYSFIEWFEKESEKFSPRHAQGLSERYKTVFNEVTVMNFHQGDDMISHYFCDILQRNKTCAFLQAQDEKPAVQRTGRPMDFARLILFAFRRNLIQTSPNQKQKNLRSLVEEVVEKLSQSNRTVLDLPHSCMSQDILDSLLNYTIAYEREYFPDWYRSPSINVNGTWTRQKFEAARTRKWCNLDTDQILSNRTLLLDLIPETALIRENLPPE